MTDDHEAGGMDSEGEFSYPRANVILSRAGFSVEVQARSAIRYGEAGKVMEIFAEQLVVGTDPRIIVRRQDVRAWRDAGGQRDVTEPERTRIIENIRRAFEFKGWILLVE